MLFCLVYVNHCHSTTEDQRLINALGRKISSAHIAAIRISMFLPNLRFFRPADNYGWRPILVNLMAGLVPNWTCASCTSTSIIPRGCGGVWDVGIASIISSECTSQDSSFLNVGDSCKWWSGLTLTANGCYPEGTDASMAIGRCIPYCLGCSRSNLMENCGELTVPTENPSCWLVGETEIQMVAIWAVVRVRGRTARLWKAHIILRSTMCRPEMRSA